MRTTPLDVSPALCYVAKLGNERNQNVDNILESYPKTVTIKGSLETTLRPLESSDEKAFHEFFLRVPETERVLFKHRVTEPQVIRDWCQRIDYGKILPLLPSPMAESLRTRPFINSLAAGSDTSDGSASWFTRIIAAAVWRGRWCGN